MDKNEQSKKKRWHKQWWGMLILAFIVLYFGSALIVRFTTNPDAKKNNPASTSATPDAQEKSKAEAPSYEIKIAGNEYFSPTARVFTFTVKNTGDKDSNPACTVDIKDESGKYTGYDYITWNTPLKPGEFKYFEDKITITNNGAQYATKSHVSCVKRGY